MSAALAQDDPFAGPEYAYWRDALAGAPPELTVGIAEPGFYRHETRRGLVPVAVWVDSTGLRLARIGQGRDQIADDSFCENVFAWCAKHPITDEVYWTVMEGGSWPDAPPAREASYSNMPGDPFEALRVEIEGERDEIERWLATDPIKDQTSCDRAANWASRIADLEKKAHDGRVTEKRPHDDAARAVQVKWKPVEDLAATLKRKLKDAQLPFQAEKRRQEAAARAAAAAKGEALRPAPRSTGAGTMGRKSTLRTERRAEIVDFDAALMGFKDNAELRELVQRLADRAARAGTTPAGCKVVLIEKVA